MEKEKIQVRIDELKRNTPASFGIMSPQHMVEHLILTLKMSYGRIKIPAFDPSEKQLTQKHALLYTDMQFPKGILAPGIGANLMELRFTDLDASKTEMLKSIDAYNNHFDELPLDETTHPRFGKLGHQEWEVFHYKHFEHHLSQFGL
jgi:hypothetical protein